MSLDALFGANGDAQPPISKPKPSASRRSFRGQIVKGGLPAASKKDNGRRVLRRVLKRKPRRQAGGGASISTWPSCHLEPDPQCAQCKFVRMAGQWSLYYGSHNHDVKTNAAKIVWLQERPRHLGGNWAIGCSLCSSLTSRSEIPKRTQRKWCTKWSCFEIREFSSMQSSTLRLHAQTNVHKLAVKAWLCPSTPVVQWLQGNLFYRWACDAGAHALFCKGHCKAGLEISDELASYLALCIGSSGFARPQSSLPCMIHGTGAPAEASQALSLSGQGTAAGPGGGTAAGPGGGHTRPGSLAAPGPEAAAHPADAETLALSGRAPQSVRALAVRHGQRHDVH